MSKYQNKAPKGEKGSARETEHLRAEIRRLKKIIRQLQKSAHVYNNIKDLVEEPITASEERPDTCNECGKGELKSLDLGIKSIITCTVCQHREVVHYGKKT